MPKIDYIRGASTRYTSVFDVGERPKATSETVPPAIASLLARHGVTLPDTMGSARKFSVAEIDNHLARRNTTLADRMLVKDGLRQLGLI
jgi:hypothetical protein